MPNSRKVQEMVDLYQSAREVLKIYGHPTVQSRKTVLALAEKMLDLDEPLSEKAALIRFVNEFRNKPTEKKLTLKRPYLLDRAMQLAAQRAASQPTMIGVNSKKEIYR